MNVFKVFNFYVEKKLGFLSRNIFNGCNYQEDFLKKNPTTTTITKNKSHGQYVLYARLTEL